MAYGSTASSLAPSITTINEYAHGETTSAGAIRSTFYGRLKDMYLPAWDDHIHEKTTMGKVLAKKKGTMGGRRSIGSVMNALPQSAGVALLEYDKLPEPSTANSFNPQIISRTMFSRLRWSAQVKNAARGGDKAAWSQPQREDIEGAKKQFELNFERVLFSGNRDILGTVGADGTAAHTMLGRNSRTSGAEYRHAFGAHYLRNNMAVALVEDSGGLVQPHEGVLNDPIDNSNIRFVSAVDRQAGTFTLSSTVGTATSSDWSTGGAGDAGALIVPWGSRRVAADMDANCDANTDSLLSSMNGIGNLAVTSTEVPYVYGLLRSSYDSLAGRMSQNGGTVRPFDERLVTLAVDRIADEGKGDEPDFLVTHASVRREMVRETAGDRRFEPVQQGRGFKNMAYTIGDVQLKVELSVDCPPGSVFILDSSTFGYFEECPMKMLDDGERFVADRAAHEITMIKAGNVACTAPFNNATIEDLAFDVSALTA